MWDALGINSTDENNFQWHNGKMIKSIDSHNAKEMELAKIYRTVSRERLIAVYKKYKFDYELFGFDFNYVLQLAGYTNLTKEEESIKPLFY